RRFYVFALFADESIVDRAQRSHGSTLRSTCYIEDRYDRTFSFYFLCPAVIWAADFCCTGVSSNGNIVFFWGDQSCGRAHAHVLGDEQLFFDVHSLFYFSRRVNAYRWAV